LLLASFSNKSSKQSSHCSTLQHIMSFEKNPNAPAEQQVYCQ
jgi:hypothetical protein